MVDSRQNDFRNFFRKKSVVYAFLSTKFWVELNHQNHLMALESNSYWKFVGRYQANLRTMWGQHGSQNDPLSTVRALTRPDFLILGYQAPPDFDGFILIPNSTQILLLIRVYNTDFFFEKNFKNHFVCNLRKIWINFFIYRGAGYKTGHKITVRSYKQPFWGKNLKKRGLITNHKNEVL